LLLATLTQVPCHTAERPLRASTWRGLSFGVLEETDRLDGGRATAPPWRGRAARGRDLQRSSPHRHGAKWRRGRSGDAPWWRVAQGP